jgi:tetratricopeptide (TPR) repeat protein
LAAYLGVICTSAVVGWRALPRAANPWLLAALLAAVAAHLVESAFAFGSVSTLLVFWLGLGMLAGHTPGRTTWRTADPGPPRPAAERPQSARRAAAAATAVVALCSLPAVLSPVLADLAYMRALAHYAGENPSGQVAWLRRAAALAPDRDLYLVALGLTLAQEAKDKPSDGRRVFLLDQAEAALRQAVSKKSGEPYNHFHLGQVLQIRAEANHLPGALSDAINSQERAAELSPSRATLVDAAGMALQRQGRAEEALVRYSRATELQGPDAERLARMGDCLVALGSYEQAHEMYEAALKLTPRSATAHAGLAELLRRHGDPAAAVESARLAARFQSREWRYREMLALLERDSGNQEEALLEARAAVRFAPPWEQERLRELVAELRAAD